jgi:hypothetical protein
MIRSGSGQNPKLPHRNIAVRFAEIRDPDLLARKRRQIYDAHLFHLAGPPHAL